MMKYPINPQSPVAMDRVCTYDADVLENVIRSQLERLGVSDMFDGKKVVIKPNLVMKKSPDAAATTHPAVLEAMLRILKEHAADIVIAESPGGLYTEQTLRSVYRGCGILETAQRMGVRLNYDTSARDAEAPDAKASKMFHIISPILDADVIVNLAKLKSHSLTGYSGTVKNYFGTVPGVEKFEMHARFPNYGDFGAMLADLCAMHISSKPTFNLLDGILAMEGNGPTGGDPRRMDCLLSGTNPFCVDMLGAYLIGAENIIMLNEGIERGYCPASAKDVILLSDEAPEAFRAEDFKKPETSRRGFSSSMLLKNLPTMFGGRLNSWFMPRPMINKAKCVGCGECVRSCPKKTIRLEQSGGKKRAVINHDNCIRCWCCQELCPFKAVKIKKNPLIRLIGG